MREGRKEREREVICSEMGIEREKQIRKKWAQRERERDRVLYVKAVEKNNKKIEKKEYFIEISCKIDKLM